MKTHYTLSALLLGLLVIPVYAFGQQPASSNVQSQIDSVQTQVQSLLQQISDTSRPDRQPTEQPDPIDEDETQTPAGQITNISPKSGKIGDEVRMNVTDDVFPNGINGSWDLYFGEGDKPVKKVDVEKLESLNSSDTRYAVVFEVPEEQFILNDCEPTENTACPHVFGSNEDVEPGTYPIWIENESGKTNEVEFEVKESGIETPTGKITNISPQSGPVGTNVELEVNQSALAGDWELHFGCASGDCEPISRELINVVQVSDSGNGEITFPVPHVITPSDPCSGDGPVVSCSDQAIVSEGKYPVWIENENGETNKVYFEVTEDQIENPAGKITNLSPESGDIGTEVTLGVSDSAVSGKGWTLHFGESKTIAQDEVELVQLASTDPDENPGARVKFTIPDDKARSGDAVYPTTPGTYSIWIENESGKTNEVEFEVTDKNSPQPTVTRTDTYKWADFTASMRYLGDNTWRYSVEGQLPTPCYGFQVQYYESLNRLAGWVTPPSGPGGCAAVIEDVSEQGTITAEKNTDFSFSVEEDKKAEPHSSPELDDAQPESGSTEPNEGTEVSPEPEAASPAPEWTEDAEPMPMPEAEDGPGVSNASEVLDQVRTQLESMQSQLLQ